MQETIQLRFQQPKMWFKHSSNCQNLTRSLLFWLQSRDTLQMVKLELCNNPKNPTDNWKNSVHAMQDKYY